MKNYTIQPISDNGLIIQFTGENNQELLPFIHSLTQQLLDEEIAGLKDIVPAFESLAIYYDPLHYTYQEMQTKLTPLLLLHENHHTQVTNHIEIPVCYDSAFGLDIEEVAARHSISVDELIHLHSNATYQVAIMGFLPGFPYINGLPKTLHTPRKSTPRTYVPKGAVGIGGTYTGIYSLPSPGGWNIIGQTPLTLFNHKREEPFILQPGDQVSFVPISKNEFERLTKEV
ncbi:5-oxoprolinase subunit PxpB [Bacillus sp. AK128]